MSGYEAETNKILDVLTEAGQMAAGSDSGIDHVLATMVAHYRREADEKDRLLNEQDSIIIALYGRLAAHIKSNKLRDGGVENLAGPAIQAAALGAMDEVNAIIEAARRGEG